VPHVLTVPALQHCDPVARIILSKICKSAIQSFIEYTPKMEDFGDVSRARAAFQQFTDAMTAGREIMRRAGVSDPPPVPEFDSVFRRLDGTSRQDLYAALRENEIATPADAVRFWQPFIRRAFNAPEKR
jgi:hypothetical protein